MRKRDGRYYHREKTSMGKVFWMEMSAAENMIRKWGKHVRGATIISA